MSSSLAAIGITMYINDGWPEELVGEDWHGLDLVIFGDLGLLLTSSIFVGIWIYRAHANLLLTDAPATEHTPGWAVGWFAIPIANLFKPFQAMKALWQASHRMEVDRLQTAPGLLWAWWISWLAGSFSGFGADYNSFDIVGYAATAISATCLILIIRQINAVQPTMSVSSTFE